MVETLIERLHEAWDVLSCLFRVKTSNKEEGINAQSCSTLPLELRRYTASCHVTSESAKMAFIVWICWKKMERFVWYISESESESEWALLARYVYTYEEFVIVTKLHSATEWQQQDRTQTTKEQYTNIQIGNVQNSKNTMQYRQSCVYRSDMCKFEMEKNYKKYICMCGE